MPFFSEETLQAVRSIPLYDIVRARVELSRSGRNWRGLSPFTEERTPSFFVIADKNYFKCHSSGMAGDGIKFIQETEKLPFPEAVEALAERFAVPIRYEKGGGPDPEVRSLKQALLDIHEYAREYYHQAFLESNPIADSVRQYWSEERGFDLDLAREFHIGFAPVNAGGLVELLKGKGFSLKAIEASGLFRAGRNRQDLSSWFSLFRGRLMIPIRNHQGQVVAFTARQLDVTPRDNPSWKAKYINSPETPIFHKSQLLFNLDRAGEAAGKAGRMLLVEGQLDALRSWSCGLEETVAPQGTSVTEEQLRLVKRYTDRLDVLLDSDEAGLRAVIRLLPLAFKERLEVRVLQLPKGMDPDDCLREHGAPAIRDLEGRSAIQFAGTALMPDDPSPEQRSRVLNRLFDMLNACPSAVVRDGYLEEAIEVTGVSPDAARADFARAEKAQLRRQAPSQNASIKKSGTIPAETLTNLEGDLLWAVLQNVAWAEPLAQVIDHQWIASDSCEGKLLSRILDHATVNGIENPDEVYLLLESDEERDCFSRFMVEDRPQFNMLVFVNETIASLARRFCRQRVKQLDGKIAELSRSSGDFSVVRPLMTEKKDLLAQITDGSFPELALPD